jgi:antitoxin (DNA-binding transcriptional repressor) of toxin-antitoxin stability system
MTGGVLQMSAKNVYPIAQVSLDELEHNLPAYLRRVEAGEAFVIVKAGKPMAEIKPPLPLAMSLRPYGLCAGEFTVPDDFDAPLSESVISEFEGR